MPVQIEVFFRALPWALPTAGLLSALGLRFVGVIGRRLKTSPWIVAMNVVALSLFISVTCTPVHGGGLWDSPHLGSLAFALPQLSEWSDVTSDGLNLWAGVMIGAPAMLLAMAMRRLWPVFAVFLVPIVAESFQALLPVLGRDGFSMDDIVRNCSGIIAGCVVGVAFYLPVGYRRLRSATPGDQHRTTQPGE